jgi:hypothetical protein
MIYFVYEVSPDDGRAADGEVYAGCWINLNDEELASERAAKFIKEQGYVIVNCVESYPITRADYTDSPDGLEYFEQALIDDEVLVLFMSEGGEDEPEN